MLLFVIIERDPASEILNADRSVAEDGYIYPISVAFLCLIDGVSEYLKHGMLAAFDAVRTENDGRTLADALRSLQHSYTVVVISVVFDSHFITPLNVLLDLS